MFTDTQVVEETFLEDINNILSSGEVPNLYKPDEFEEVEYMYALSLAEVFRFNVAALLSRYPQIRLERPL